MVLDQVPKTYLYRFIDHIPSLYEVQGQYFEFGMMN